jgi:hypothetical protein
VGPLAVKVSVQLLVPNTAASEHPVVPLPLTVTVPVAASRAHLVGGVAHLVRLYRGRVRTCILRGPGCRHRNADRQQGCECDCNPLHILLLLVADICPQREM